MTHPTLWTAVFSTLFATAALAGGTRAGGHEHGASPIGEEGKAAEVTRTVEILPSEFFRGLTFAEIAALLADVDGLRRGLAPDALPDALRQARKLRKAFAQVAETDFFPGEAQRQVAQALHELELACARALSPDEPQPAVGDLGPLALADHLAPMARDPGLDHGRHPHEAHPRLQGGQLQEPPRTGRSPRRGRAGAVLSGGCELDFLWRETAGDGES